MRSDDILTSVSSDIALCACEHGWR